MTPSDAASAISLPLKLRRRHRFIVSVVIGVCCGVFSFAAIRAPGFRDQDFHLWWLAARAVIAGQDPYKVIQAGVGRGFVYPLTTALATVPFAWLPSKLAGPLFVGSSCAALAFVITRVAWWPLLMFLNASMVLSVVEAQWSPLLTAAIVAPALTWLGVLKPNIGLAIVAYRPSIRTVLVIMAVVLASLFVMPSWPREWISAASGSPIHFSPWRAPGGILILAVLARWRRPESRMLTLLALVPSSPIIYESLPLFTIARQRAEVVILGLFVDLAYFLTMDLSLEGNTAEYLRIARSAMVWLVYVPCAVMILRRPNEGNVPALVERFISRAPTWLRGRACPVPRPNMLAGSADDLSD